MIVWLEATDMHSIPFLPISHNGLRAWDAELLSACDLTHRCYTNAMHLEPNLTTDETQSSRHVASCNSVDIA
eukprot:3919549-Amphidinium_carterae.1